jgi:hypothetical protein
MRYSVVWSKTALGHLANVYLQAPDPQAVTKAADRIDSALKDDPDAKSQSFGQFFIYEDSPLAALFEIIPDDRMVRVLTVKLIP